jgi:hypothetical protein
MNVIKKSTAIIIYFILLLLKILRVKSSSVLLSSINFVGVLRREIIPSQNLYLKQNLARFRALSEAGPVPQPYSGPHVALCVHCCCDIHTYIVMNLVLVKTNRIFNINVLVL